MKKNMLILLIISLCVPITGCGKTENLPGETREVEDEAVQNIETAKINEESQDIGMENTTLEDARENKSNILIAYFTRADNIEIDPEIDAVASASININGSSYQGNLAIMADYIKEVVNGDTFSIVTTEYYPTGYRDTTNMAKEEQRGNARPELSDHVENMEDYDIIFLGFPNWWGGLPMPVYTFLEEYDFTGKTIIPFASHEGSGLGSGPSEIAQICPNTDVLDGYAVRGSDVSSCETDIVKWIESLNLEQTHE